jgi:hypothetical protein
VQTGLRPVAWLEKRLDNRAAQESYAAGYRLAWSILSTAPARVPQWEGDLANFARQTPDPFGDIRKLGAARAENDFAARNLTAA